MEFIIYFNNKPIETKYLKSIAKTILHLNLKKGDILQLRPFNFFEDENTGFKEKEEDYHGVELRIVHMKYYLTNSWNSSINTTIEIYLKINE